MWPMIWGVVSDRSRCRKARGHGYGTNTTRWADPTKYGQTQGGLPRYQKMLTVRWPNQCQARPPWTMTNNFCRTMQVPGWADLYSARTGALLSHLLSQVSEAGLFDNMHAALVSSHRLEGWGRVCEAWKSKWLHLPFSILCVAAKKIQKILTHYGKVQASIAKVKRSYAEFYRPHSLSLQGIWAYFAKLRGWLYT